MSDDGLMAEKGDQVVHTDTSFWWGQSPGEVSNSAMLSIAGASGTWGGVGHEVGMGHQPVAKKCHSGHGRSDSQMVKYLDRDSPGQGKRREGPRAGSGSFHPA